jgi:type IV pilus assembly protein PilA
MIFSGKKGVTLIELLVVVAIIGVLAAVAIPRYGELLEKANLGATLGNLGALRSAYSIYYGTYLEAPKSIDPNQDPQFGKVLNGGLPYVKARYPYGANSPYGNQVTVSAVKGVVPAVQGQGWFYNSVDGYIYVNSTANDIKGNPYTSY